MSFIFSFRYIRVKVSAKFRCHSCRGRTWSSHHAWVEFDIREREVRRVFGQKCKLCREFYSRPLPFYFDTHQISGGFKSSAWTS